MARNFAHLLGATSVLLTSLFWLALLSAGKADRLANSFAGSQNEYKVVLGVGLVAVVFAFAAAIRGGRWWFVALTFSGGTLGFFTFLLAR